MTDSSPAPASWGGLPRESLRLLVPAVALLVVAGCSGESEAPPEPPVRPAKLMVVAASENTRTIDLPAVIDASATADLAFQVSGLLLSVPVREGQTIAEGTEIARLDQRDLRNDLATARANREAASSAFQRGERLVAQDAISRAEYDQLKTRRDVAQVALDAAAKRLDDSVLRSPFAGVVADLHVEAHQNVTAQQVVVTLQTTDAAAAVVQAPATLMANSGRLGRGTCILIVGAPLPSCSAKPILREDCAVTSPDLIEVSEALTETGRGGPTQARLRRAASTAHTGLTPAATESTPPPRKE